MADTKSFGEMFDEMMAPWVKALREGRCPMCGRKNDNVDEMKKACTSGDHCWDIGAIGPGVASFSCNHCDGRSEGSLEPMRQYGFAPELDGKSWVKRPKNENH